MTTVVTTWHQVIARAVPCCARVIDGPDRGREARIAAEIIVGTDRFEAACLRDRQGLTRE